SEPLKLAKTDVDLAAATATLRNMKNERDRLVYLPPVVVDDLRQMPDGLAGPGRLFSFHAGGRLRDLLKMTLAEAGVVLPRRLPRVLPYLGALDASARRPRHLRSRSHRPLGRSRVGRSVRACGGERAGAPGGPIAGRKEGGLIRGESVENCEYRAPSSACVP